MTPRDLDRADWLRLSPLLDELLDLPDDAAREARLAALRGEDPAAAEQLTQLLAQHLRLDGSAFLLRPALPPPAGLAGQAVGAYVLAREIGHGGMGTVWLAHRADGRYEGQVAIKFMRAALLRPADSERFLREGQMLARLDHPNIARLLDAGISQPAGQPYLVLDFVQGLPIDQFCDTQQLDIKARVRLMRQVLAAVAHAHSRLILHRDLKPSNILVTAGGEPKLLDFGVGKLLNEGSAGDAKTDTLTAEDLTRIAGLAFTARYAAPEQLQGQEVTTATDVYSLGVLLYGLLGGGHPTEGAHTTPLAQMQALAQTQPRRLSEAVLRAHRPGAQTQARALRGDLDTIVARALKKNPAERYANAAELSDDLRRWLDREPITTRRDSAGYRISRYVQRHGRIFVAAGTAGALALTAGAGAALWQANEARVQRAQAEALVAFMLGDLQPKLFEIGRPDLLQAVGTQALAYFAREDLQKLEAPALAQRAQALRMIGESARQRLDHAQARAAIEQAAQTTGQLLALAPKDLQRLKDHAESLERMVYLLDGTEDNLARQQVCEQLSAVRWRAAALAPQDDAIKLQAVYSDTWLASALLHNDQASDSLVLLNGVQRGLHSLSPDLPSWKRFWAITLLLTGQAHLQLGRYAEAADSLRAFVATHPERHEAVPDLTERGENLIGKSLLVRALLNQGQPAPATALAAQMLAHAETEAEQNPGNLLLAERAIQYRSQLAMLYLLAGDKPAAQEQLAAIATRVLRVGPVPADNTQWHVVTMGELLVLRARLQPDPPAPQQADPALLAALQAHANHVAGLNSREKRGSRSVLMSVGLVHGDNLLAQGRPEAARLRWQAVADLALPDAQAGRHPAMQRLALALLRLGQPQQARPWVERLQASTWRHPDLADLQRRLAAAEGVGLVPARDALPAPSSAKTAKT